jgi:hypothetical protein
MSSDTYMYSTSWILLCQPIFPLAPPAPASHFFTCEPPFFTYLEVPFLMIVVRMSIHTRPSLVTDCPPLTSYLPPPPPPPNAPTVHVTCFQRRHHNISYIVWYNNCFLKGQWHAITVAWAKIIWMDASWLKEGSPAFPYFLNWIFYWILSY